MSVYVIDASVAVKWLNQDREEATEEAMHLLAETAAGRYQLVSSELLVYEVMNVLVRAKGLRGRVLEQAVRTFFQLPLHLVSCTPSLAAVAAVMAEEYRLTFYDAVYVALAYEQGVSLITANVKHQARVPAVPVLDISNWPLLKKEL